MQNQSRARIYLRYLAINFASVFSALITAIVLPRILKIRSDQLTGEWFFGCQLGGLLAALTSGFGMIATRVSNQGGASEVPAQLRRSVGVLSVVLLGLLAAISLVGSGFMSWPTALAIVTTLPIPIGQVALASSAARDSVRSVVSKILYYRALPVFLALGFALILILKPVIPYAQPISSVAWILLGMVAWWLLGRGVVPKESTPRPMLKEAIGLGAQSGLYQWTILACVLFLGWSRKLKPGVALPEADYIVASAVFHLAGQVQSLSNQLQSPQVALFAREPLASESGRSLMIDFMRLGARTSILAILALQWFSYFLLYRIYSFAGTDLVNDMVLWLGIATFLRLCMTPLANGVFATPHSRLLMPILVIEAIVAAGVGFAAWSFHAYRVLAALPAIDAVVCWIASLVLLRKTSFRESIYRMESDRGLLVELCVGLGVIAVSSTLLSRGQIVAAAIVGALSLTYSGFHLARDLRRFLAARKLART